MIWSRARSNTLRTTANKRGWTGIEAVAMDMWEPYVQVTLAHVPTAAHQIVFDRVHIMRHMGHAVDTVRKQDHRARTAEGDAVLAGTKYLWLYAQENLSRAAPGALCGTQGPHPQDRPGLGHQGEPA
ncbi:MAG: transposase [Nitrospiraceae bacterium]